MPDEVVLLLLHSFGHIDTQLEAVDLVSVALKRWFDQESVTLPVNQERAIIVAAEGETVDLEAR